MRRLYRLIEASLIGDLIGGVALMVILIGSFWIVGGLSCPATPKTPPRPLRIGQLPVFWHLTHAIPHGPQPKETQNE